MNHTKRVEGVCEACKEAGCRHDGCCRSAESIAAKKRLMGMLASSIPTPGVKQDPIFDLLDKITKGKMPGVQLIPLTPPEGISNEQFPAFVSQLAGVGRMPPVEEDHTLCPCGKQGTSASSDGAWLCSDCLLKQMGVS